MTQHSAPSLPVRPDDTIWSQDARLFPLRRSAVYKRYGWDRVQTLEMESSRGFATMLKAIQYGGVWECKSARANHLGWFRITPRRSTGVVFRERSGKVSQWVQRSYCAVLWSRIVVLFSFSGRLLVRGGCWLVPRVQGSLGMLHWEVWDFAMGDENVVMNFKAYTSVCIYLLCDMDSYHTLGASGVHTCCVCLCAVILFE